MLTGSQPLFCDRVPRSEKLQAEYTGAPGPGGDGSSADGHVGRGRGVRARRARVEPRPATRQLYTHSLLNHKVRPRRLLAPPSSIFSLRCGELPSSAKQIKMLILIYDSAKLPCYTDILTS